MSPDQFRGGQMPIIISEDSDDESRLQIRNQQNKRKLRKSRRRRGQSGNRAGIMGVKQTRQYSNAQWANRFLFLTL